MVLSVPELVDHLGKEYGFVYPRKAYKIVHSRPPKPLSGFRLIDFFRGGHTSHELDLVNPNQVRVGFDRLPTDDVGYLYAFIPVLTRPEVMSKLDYLNMGIKISNERDIAFDDFGLGEEQNAFYGFLKESPKSFHEVDSLISRVHISARDMNNKLVESLNQGLVIS